MVKRKRSDNKEYQYTKDPGAITNFLKTMLYMFIAVSMMMFVSNIIQVYLIGSMQLTQAGIIANDARQQLVFVQYLVVLILTSVAFLFWIYRTNANCHGFGAKSMRFSPVWSIGYFFVPIFNFFKPYLAMKEIWKVSTDPAEWQQDKGGVLIGWWWGLWLLSLLSFISSFFLPTQVASIGDMQRLTLITVLASLIDILHGTVALLLVSAIYKKQENLVKGDS